jgi:hypothetical protein
MKQSTKGFCLSVMTELCATAAMGCAYSQWSAAFHHDELDVIWKDKPDVMRKQREVRLTIAELKDLSENDLFDIGFRRWNKELVIIPLYLYNYIADGETLICIDGKGAIKGKDFIDLDVRFGCLAYGFYK